MWWKKLKKASKEDVEKYNEQVRAEKLGAKDKFAMLFSSFIVIVVPCTLVLAAIGALGLLLFGAL